MTAKRVTEAIRTYEIDTSGGLFRIDIPEDWKVTYAPVSPAGAKGYGGDPTLALRVYENDTKQRAIFTNVRSFRDLSIPVQRLEVKKKGSDSWEADRNGSKSSSETVIERRWVPDTNDA